MSPVPSPRVSSEIEAANRGGRIPVLFIHGLWVLPSSWASWAEVFEAQGYAPVLADWPGDPRSVQDARENPGVFGSQTVASTVEHLEAICDALDETPVIIGHSFGGLFAQMLAARGRSHRWALPWHPAHALGERAWCRQPERARARRSRSLPGAWA